MRRIALKNNNTDRFLPSDRLRRPHFVWFYWPSPLLFWRTGSTGVAGFSCAQQESGASGTHPTPGIPIVGTSGQAGRSKKSARMPLSSLRLCRIANSNVPQRRHASVERSVIVHFSKESQYEGTNG